MLAPLTMSHSTRKAIRRQFARRLRASTAPTASSTDATAYCASSIRRNGLRDDQARCRGELAQDRLNREYLKELSKRGAGDAYSWVDSATPEQIRNFAITRQVANEFGVDVRDLTFGDGGGVAANSPRYQQGQANDPTCSLRDDDDDYGDSDFWDDEDKQKDDDWRSDRHLRCRDFHRNQAQYAKRMNRCAAYRVQPIYKATAARTHNSADYTRSTRSHTQGGTSPM